MTSEADFLLLKKQQKDFLLKKQTEVEVEIIFFKIKNIYIFHTYNLLINISYKFNLVLSKYFIYQYIYFPKTFCLKN